MKRLLIAVAFSGIIGGCASGTAEMGSSAGDGKIERQLSLLQAELSALEQPSGVGDGLWASLCQELERSVAAGAAAGALQGSSPVRAASQLSEPALSYEYAPRFLHSEGRLTTFHVLTGDYDENGEVNGADLVPLAQFYLESAQPSARFPQDSRQYVIDGDGNGLINISDVTVIGQHFKERAVAYNIYASEDLGADFPYEAGASLIEPLHSVPFTGIHAADDKRRVIEYDLAGELYSHYWLRIETEDGEGPPSQLAYHGQGAPALAQFIEPWTQLSYDSESGQVIWTNRLSGDGDGNSEINISDMTVIGSFFGSEYELYYGLAPGESFSGRPGADPDMNRDLAVNSRDLLLVQSYLGMGSEGFRLFHTELASEVPVQPWAEENLEPIDTAGVSSFELGPGASGYIWLRAYRGDELGPVSAMLEL